MVSSLYLSNQIDGFKEATEAEQISRPDQHVVLVDNFAGILVSSRKMAETIKYKYCSMFLPLVDKDCGSRDTIIPQQSATKANISDAPEFEQC